MEALLPEHAENDRECVVEPRDEGHRVLNEVIPSGGTEVHLQRTSDA